MYVAWAFAAFTFWCLVYGIREAWRQHKAHLKSIEDIHRRSMFSVAKEELRALENIIERDPRGFRKRRHNEPPWDYVRSMALRGGMGLKPWQPTFGSLTFARPVRQDVFRSVSISSRIEVYTTTIEGVVHRVGLLPIQGAGYATVLLCEPTQAVESAVDVHEHDASPAITCLGCVVKAVH